MSCEEKVEAAQAIDFAALNMAKINVVNQTLAQRAALIDVKKIQAELKRTKETRRQLEVELELVKEKAAVEKARAEVDQRQQQFELEKLRLMKDTAVAQASTQGTSFYHQPAYFPQPIFQPQHVFPPQFPPYPPHPPVLAPETVTTSLPLPPA